MGPTAKRPWPTSGPFRLWSGSSGHSSRRPYPWRMPLRLSTPGFWLFFLIVNVLGGLAGAAGESQLAAAAASDQTGVTVAGVLVGAAATLAGVLVAHQVTNVTQLPTDGEAGDIETAKPAGKSNKRAAKVASMALARKKRPTAETASTPAAAGEAQCTENIADRDHSRVNSAQHLSPGDMTDRYVRGIAFSETAGTCSEGLTQNLRAIEAEIDKLCFGNAARKDQARKYMFPQCIKEEGKEDIPTVPRKGCMHAVEQAKWQLLDEGVMSKCRGPRELDASVVAGTLSHYHFRFIAEGKLQMRWLSCPCRACLSKDWSNCVNKSWVGLFHDVEQTQIGAHGIGLKNASKKEALDTMLQDSAVGDVVAIYTSVDDSKHKYWLARIEQCAWVLPSAYVCSSSGDKFDEGARVLKVTYFNREGGDRIFRHREDLGTFTICSSLLRKHKIALPEINGRGRRHALPLCDLSFEIGEQLDREIKTTIMHVFQDD